MQIVLHYVISLVISSVALAQGNSASQSYAYSLKDLGQTVVDPYVRPDRDLFYSAPENLSSYANGDVIRWRQPPNPLTFIGDYDDAWQILYKSTNTHGDPVAIVTTLVRPCNVRSDAVVSYQYPEDSTYIGCAPSYFLQRALVYEEFVNILAQGVYLNIPDYEGMNSAFGAAILAAHATLDSVRAIQSMTNITGLAKDSRAVLWGYSNGSLTSAWAGQLLASYAPDLNIAAVILGGFAANISAIVPYINRTPGVGFAFGAMLGLPSEYPQLKSIYNFLEPSKASKFLNGLTICRDEALKYFANEDVFSYFTNGPQIIKETGFGEVIQNLTLGTMPIKVPVMVYMGSEDDVVPLNETNACIQRYCDMGSTVDYYQIPGLNHDQAEFAGFPLALDYAVSALNGLKSTQTGCATKTTNIPFVTPSTPAALPKTGCGTVTAASGAPTGIMTVSPVSQVMQGTGAVAKSNLALVALSLAVWLML